MKNTTRIARLGAIAVTTAALAACSNTPLFPQSSTYPTATYPTATYPAPGAYPGGGQVATAPASTVFGRVSAIEYVPQGAAQDPNRTNILGAVVGGLAGAVLGSQVGSGSGRDAATVIGGLGGAAAGSQYGRGNQPQATGGPSYRVTVVTDQGTTRMYEVAATGDLRVGDRVRVDNGIIYRV
ncbi:glycine zipper 2TM domain-containing protein [Ramlibacter sp. AN1015]|uniref:glycine zipper 2TM domain-containing protein n=1 Tax=Ramlibacter sp. AN1015 TaxID=3133428 RepID=UPI0030C47093